MSGNDRLKFWLLLLGVAAAAVYSFWYAFKAWRENRVVEDTPTSRVRSAAQGYVELTGRGVMPPHKETMAPLTGKPCTWWRYKIEERRSSGRSRGWTKVDGGTSEEPFVLDDGTGQCMIDPRGAEVFPVSKDVWYGSTDGRKCAYRTERGSSARWRMCCFQAAATGTPSIACSRMRPSARSARTAVSEALGADDPEAAVAALLHEWKQDQKSLLARFDKNHDGALDAAEWDQARAAAHKQVVERMVVQPVTPRTVRLVQARGRPRIHVVGLRRRGACAAPAPQRRRRHRHLRGQHGRPRLDGDAPLIESWSEQPTTGSGSFTRLRPHRGRLMPARRSSTSWRRTVRGLRS